MLKRPVKAANRGQQGYSTESIHQIHAAFEHQVAALDARIARVHRDLREAQG
jgi:hypothetical protein